LLCPLCIFGANPSESTPVIDSLTFLVSNLNSEKEKVDVYNKIAFQYLFIDTTKALNYIDTASTISTEIDYPQGLARALNIHAIHHTFQNRQSQSLELNKKALTYCGENDHFVKGKIYNGIGLSYQRTYIIDKSLENYHKALFHSSENKDTLTMAIVLGNIAGLNSTQSNDKEAKRYFLQLEEVAENYNDLNVQFAFHLRFAEFLTKKEEYDESIKQLNKALLIGNKLQHNSKLRLVELQLIINYVNNRKFKLAKEHLQILIDPKLDPTEHTFMRYEYWSSDLEFRKKNFQVAINHANIGLEKIEKLDDYYFYKPRFLEILHDSYKQLKNFDKAYAHLKELKIWQDSIDLKERENKFIELESKFQSEKKEIENALLFEQSNIKSAKLKQRSIITVASLITLFLALILAYILFRDAKKEKNAKEVLEDRVAERTQKLQKSNEELERFAYIASHDLKEPITSIKSFTQLLKQELLSGQNSDRVDQYVGIIEKSSDQMKFLVNGILDYTKLGDDVSKERVDLNDILREVELYLQQHIASENAQITSNHLPTIRCNSIQIFQVFKNLIENGIKYNQSTECKVEIYFSETSGNIMLDFKDNGIGIDEKYKDQIFEMFSRLNNRSEYKGSGLGLSIVKKITNSLGGEISLIKSDASGTTFRVVIPKEISSKK